MLSAVGLCFKKVDVGSDAAALCIVNRGEWKVVDESGVGWNSQFCAVGGNLVYGTEQLEVSSQKKQL